MFDAAGVDRAVAMVNGGEVLAAASDKIGEQWSEAAIFDFVHAGGMMILDLVNANDGLDFGIVEKFQGRVDVSGGSLGTSGLKQKKKIEPSAALGQYVFDHCG